MSTIVPRNPPVQPGVHKASAHHLEIQKNVVTDHIDSNKVIVSSYLSKRSSKTHQWKKRWVVLRNCQLSYYKDSSEHKANKVINRANLQSFSRIPDNQKYHFAIYTNNKVLHFKTLEKAVYKNWILALEEFFKENAEEDEIEDKEGKSSDKIKTKENEVQETKTEIPKKPEFKRQLTSQSYADNEREEDDEDEDEEEDGDEEDGDQNSSQKSQNLVSLSSNSLSQLHPSQGTRQSLVMSVKRTNSYADEYSGPEDPYLSSGVSDSQLQDSPTFATAPFTLQHSIKVAEEDEEQEQGTDVMTKELPKQMENLIVEKVEIDKAKKSEPESQKLTKKESPVSEEEDEYLIEMGHLLRLRKRYNQWKRFYIVLTNKKLYFYKSESISKVYKVIDVRNIIDVIELDPMSRSKQWCLLIITPLKRIRFCASSEEEMIKWLSSLKAIIMRNKNRKITRKEKT